jgi:hypothetical protein
VSLALWCQHTAVSILILQIISCRTRTFAKATEQVISTRGNRAQRGSLKRFAQRPSRKWKGDETEGTIYWVAVASSRGAKQTRSWSRAPGTSSAQRDREAKKGAAPTALLLVRETTMLLGDGSHR